MDMDLERPIVFGLLKSLAVFGLWKDAQRPAQRQCTFPDGHWHIQLNAALKPPTMDEPG